MSERDRMTHRRAGALLANAIMNKACREEKCPLCGHVGRAVHKQECPLIAYAKNTIEAQDNERA